MNGTLWVAGFSQELTQRVIDRFEAMLNCKIQFQVIEKKELLGGFVAHIDGKAYDASLLTRLGGIHDCFMRDGDL